MASVHRYLVFAVSQRPRLYYFLTASLPHTTVLTAAPFRLYLIWASGIRLVRNSWRLGHSLGKAFGGNTWDRDSKLSYTNLFLTKNYFKYVNMDQFLSTYGTDYVAQGDFLILRIKRNFLRTYPTSQSYIELTIREA